MKDLNPEKLAEQKAFIELWKSNGAKGTLEAVTGFGKTAVALLTIKDMNERYPDRITQIVVPTLVLQKQWLLEIKSWGLKNVSVHVINSYVMTPRSTHLLVLDEIHRYGSTVFSKVFEVTRYNFIMGLTATMERQDGMHELIEDYCPIIKKITLKEALEKGYVSEYVVFNLPVFLTKLDSNSYDQMNRKFNYYFSFFQNDFDLAMACLTDADRRKAYAEELGVEEKSVMVAAVNFSRFLRERKTFLYENKSKLLAVTEIAKHFSDKKIIVFSETAAFADEVAKSTGYKSFPYHTKVGKKEARENMEAFKTSKKFNLISAVRSIEEGLDIKDLDLVVMVSGNSTKRQYIQRLGRGIRVKDNKLAVIINIYIHGTQDEVWLRRRQSTNTSNVLWVNTVDEIKRFLDKEFNATTIGLQPDQLNDQPEESPVFNL